MYYQGCYSYANPCCCGVGGYPGGFGSGAALILVLFILLVIILGARFI